MCLVVWGVQRYPWRPQEDNISPVARFEPPTLPVPTPLATLSTDRARALGTGCGVCNPDVARGLFTPSEPFCDTMLKYTQSYLQCWMLEG